MQTWRILSSHHLPGLDSSHFEQNKLNGDYNDQMGVPVSLNMRQGELNE